MPSTYDLMAHLVGREAELQCLQHHLRAMVDSGQPRLVLIVGEPGIGKTCLAERFLAGATGVGGVRVARSRCAGRVEEASPAPFAHLLTQFGRQVGRSVDSRDLLRTLAKVAPAWLDIFTRGLAGAVATTAETVRDLGRRRGYTEHSLFTEYTTAMRDLSRRQPLIAFIDDLHWADRASLVLLTHLALHLEGCPVLFLATVRPVEAEEIGTHRAEYRRLRALIGRTDLPTQADELLLEEGLDVATYLATRYPRICFPSLLLQRLQQQTDGHPFFLDQLCSLWEEHGVIAGRTIGATGVYEYALRQDVDEVPIPKGLAVLLDERLGQLPSPLHEVLRPAAVEGDGFSAQVVAHACGKDEAEVVGLLTQLAEPYGLVVEDDAQSNGDGCLDTFRFAHRFLRDHVYGHLGRAQRRLLHGRVAEGLQVVHEDTAPVAAAIAHHLSMAGRRNQAAPYALRAAQYEISHHMLAEAQRWCEQGLAWLGEEEGAEADRLRLDLLATLAEALDLSGQYEAAADRYGQAVEMLEHIMVDPALAATICARAADVCDDADEYDLGVVYVRRGLQFLRAVSGPTSEAHVLVRAAEALLTTRQGRHEEAIAIARAALQDLDGLPRSPDLVDTRLHVLNTLALSLGFLYRLDESVVTYRAGLDLADRHGMRYWSALLRMNMAEDQFAALQLADAETNAGQAAEVAHSAGDQGNLAYCLELRGRIQLRMGRLDDAYATLCRAASTAQSIGYHSIASGAHATRALVHLARGEVAAAQQMALLGAGIANTVGSRAYAWEALARALAAAGQARRAKALFDRALERWVENDYPSLTAEAQRNYALVLLRCGERERALALLREALETYRSLPLPAEAEGTERLLREAEGHP